MCSYLYLCGFMYIHLSFVLACICMYLRLCVLYFHVFGFTHVQLCIFFASTPPLFPTPYHYPVSLPSQAVAARDPDAGLGRRPKNMRCDTSNFDNIKGFAAQMLRLRGANVKASRPKCQGFEGGFSDAKLRGFWRRGGR